jgi:hypothetical protein
MLPPIHTMEITKLFGKFAVLSLLTAVFCTSLPAQKLPEPRQERLLNGLKLLMWPDAKADKVWLKLRIHSGSAFDPQGKEGTIKLLSDTFFPNENARDFFADDLGGELQIVTTYDYIQVNASARPDQLVNLIDTVATAVSNPTIDKETTSRLRSALLAKVNEWADDPAYVADRAVANRLLGDFPYGRPLYGTADSLKRIDAADLVDARLRFLTADNATLAISGNFDSQLAFRAVRRYFGSWLKSDKTVPSTFRQPDEPAAAVISLPSPKLGGAAARFAFRGVARGDKDLAPSLVYSKVLEGRLRSRRAGQQVFVRNEFRTLPGIVVIGWPAKIDDKGMASITAEDRRFVIDSVAASITDAEFQAAKAAAAGEWGKRDAVSFWLDADTYKTAGPDPDARIFDRVTLADVNTYAAKARSLPLVSIVIGAQPVKQ